MDYENIVEETKVVEEVVTKTASKGGKIVAGVVAACVAGAALVKFVVMPVCGKIKAKKEEKDSIVTDEQSNDVES